jgi:hypothetical protein
MALKPRRTNTPLNAPAWLWGARSEKCQTKKLISVGLRVRFCRPNLQNKKRFPRYIFCRELVRYDLERKFSRQKATIYRTPHLGANLICRGPAHIHVWVDQECLTTAICGLQSRIKYCATQLVRTEHAHPLDWHIWFHPCVSLGLDVESHPMVLHFPTNSQIFVWYMYFVPTIERIARTIN